jgi:ubiquinone/menaquinone biosynthesis C-methylase UbiE
MDTSGNTNKWSSTTAMDHKAVNKFPPSYPNECMVKVFSSPSYSNNFSPIQAGEKVLDVGCCYCNNLLFFLDRGCEGYGVDVNEDMIEISKERLQVLNRKAQIEVGSNESIPFQDSTFDYLISVATIHYQQDLVGVNKALKEFKRVVKPNGKIFVLTVGPQHEIIEKSHRKGELNWEVDNYDFRNGNIMSFFDNQQHFENVLSSHFSKIDVGVLTENYSTTVLEFLHALCINEK